MTKLESLPLHTPKTKVQKFNRNAMPKFITIINQREFIVFKIETKYPIAIDSDDHKYPEGVFYDNRVSGQFIESVEHYFNKKINFLDQGCAGGALVVEMSQRGHNAVGLDGSDQIYKPSEELLREMGRNPYGYDNWQKYYGKNLFTCDLSKPYQILFNDKTAQFDLITSWDVMEHFDPESVKTVAEMTKNHLKDDGVFVASIAIFHATRQQSPLGPGHLKVPQVDYHKSVFAKEWWQEQLLHYFDEIDYPFNSTNRPLDSRYYLFAGKKKNG